MKIGLDYKNAAVHIVLSMEHDREILVRHFMQGRKLGVDPTTFYMVLMNQGLCDHAIADLDKDEVDKKQSDSCY